MIPFNQLERLEMPDGMSLRKLDSRYFGETMSTIQASIRSYADLIELGQVVETLRRQYINIVDLDLHYLIGSRMDRPMNIVSPNTLKVVCDTINQMGFRRIRTHWSHSSSTTDRLNAISNTGYEMRFIGDGTRICRAAAPDKEYDLIIPDSGAAKRFYNDHAAVSYGQTRIIECGKKRNMETGHLSGFTVPCSVGKTCIIVDDLCDGGGTFMGLASELRKNGASFVGLVVYHGIFSKGQDLDGVDFVYTTNSFRDNLEPHSDFIIEEVV